MIMPQIDLAHGFLPTSDPLQRLPNAFQVLEEFGACLPKLLLSDGLRTALENLPKINISDLHSTTEYERAMVLLSFLGHGYVWGAKNPATKIPQALAKPWFEVAKKLNRPPVLSYASYALHNWRRINKERPIELGNIVLLQNFLGGIDEEWFVLVHVDIEAKAAPALQAIVSLQNAISQNDNGAVENALFTMVQSLQAMCETLDRMPEHCDPYIYYNRVRPYIHAWKDNPALPDGIIYEGVKAYAGRPQKFRGETGAQSAIVPALDAALSIKHKDDPLRIYLMEMREYMPQEQREFLHWVEENSQIRKFVKNNNLQSPMLRNHYNECIQLLTRFRTTHLRYAAQYIQKQSQTSLANPTAVGTGGTPFMEYLKKHKDEAEAHLL